MNPNIIFIIAIIILFLLGVLIGFSKLIKKRAKGILGFLAAVFLSFTFGGMILGIQAVSDLIIRGNEFFGETWQFLDTIGLSTIIYYIAITLIFFILIRVASHLIGSLFSSDKKVIVIINRALGGVFAVGSALALMLIVFSIMRSFEHTEFVTNFVTSIEGTYFYPLFIHNPIQIWPT